MNIIIHTQYYLPEVGAPQTRLHELALGLKLLGIQVTVLTAMPSYPRGRLYPGYSGWLRIENLGGIKVIRVASFPTQSTRLVPRLFSYFSFMITSFLIGGWKLDRADYLLTESPPLFLGLAGFFLSRWKRARWIFNISDLWPQSVVELGLIDQDSLSNKLSTILEIFLYHRAWLVTAQSRTILENIESRSSFIHPYYLPNGVNTDFFHPMEVPQENNFHIIYAGLHGLAQGLEQIIWAAHKLKSEETIDYTFIGDGPKKQFLMKLVSDLSLSHFHFLDPVPKSNIPQILSTADVLVIPLKIQLTGAVPSKLYEAMAMEKPVILIAESEASVIVYEANCGIVVKPGDIDGLSAAITYLKDKPEVRKQMGLNGRQAAIEKYERRRIVTDFAHYLLNT